MKRYLHTSIIMLMFILSAVSCNTEQIVEEPVLTFDVTISVTDDKTADIKVVPSIDDMSYYYGIIPVSEYIDDSSLKLDDMLLLESIADENDTDIEKVIASHLSTGTVIKEYNNLLPAVSYYFYVYQMTEDGMAPNAIFKKQFTMTGYENVNIGDFYMIDGTIVSKDSDVSEDFIENIAGIVFWVGDPSSEGNDSALLRECPECKHGLVMALDTIQTIWCNNTQKLISNWVKAEGEYEEIVAGPWGKDRPYNFIKGYNNTKAIEAYNENASDYDRVIAIDEVVALRDSVSLPWSTSDWYLPSAKEVSLMITGEIDIDIHSVHAVDGPFPENLKIINASLEKIGYPIIGQWESYNTSTENSPGIIYTVMSNGCVTGNYKNIKARIRPVFAF